MSDAELRILLCVVVPQHRTEHGSLQCNSGRGSVEPLHFKASMVHEQLADAPEPPALRTAQHALTSLSNRGLLRVVMKASGRRPAQYKAWWLADDPKPKEQGRKRKSK